MPYWKFMLDHMKLSKEVKISIPFRRATFMCSCFWNKELKLMFVTYCLNRIFPHLMWYIIDVRCCKSWNFTLRVVKCDFGKYKVWHLMSRLLKFWQRTKRICTLFDGLKQINYLQIVQIKIQMWNISNY